VREGQKLGRAAFERHVAMGNGALKRQGGGKLVDMGRILDELRGTLESHVVIAMRCLGLATRIDNIDLRGDLVEPVTFDWVGRFDSKTKTIDTKFPQPADLADE